MRKIQKIKVFTKSKSLLTNKSFILEIEGHKKKNSLFNILSNERIKNQHIMCDIISII